MLSGDALILVIGGALTLAALTVVYFITGEVLRVIRDFFGNLRSESERTQVGGRTQERSSELRSRAAVERLITHFEEPETGSSRESRPE